MTKQKKKKVIIIIIIIISVVFSFFTNQYKSMCHCVLYFKSENERDRDG